MTYRPVCDTWILARPRLLEGRRLYGAYPGGYPERARALLGVHIDDPVLHVCGGLLRYYAYRKRAVGPNDKTLDLDPLMKADFIQDARDPYPRGFRAVLADPPYSEADADKYVPGRKQLPTPNMIAKRAIDSMEIGCRVGVLCYAWTAPPPGSMEVAVISVLTGRNQRARVLTVIEKVSDAGKERV